MHACIYMSVNVSQSVLCACVCVTEREGGGIRMKHGGPGAWVGRGLQKPTGCGQGGPSAEQDGVVGRGGGALASVVPSYCPGHPYMLQADFQMRIWIQEGGARLGWPAGTGCWHCSQLGLCPWAPCSLRCSPIRGRARGGKAQRAGHCFLMGLSIISHMIPASLQLIQTASLAGFK